MDDDELLATLHAAADAIRAALDSLADWGLAGTRPGQYHSDLAADTAARAVLSEAGLGILSEETGLHDADRDLIAVLDPVDGSTNASRGIPWFATSICVLDADGPRAALVVNQASGRRYEAVRGKGARCDGVVIAPSAATALSASLIGLSGYPPHHLGFRQFRSLGAAALDLCAVASGLLDGYVDCTPGGQHGSWDYLGGMLVCTEAGAVVTDAFDRDLVTREPAERRCPTAAATPALLAELKAARTTFP
ncbi:MAG TPA: inositol monophosphatase family protein [Acidimicrobiales bacterium]|nr:inositol monophosphatase family protein [Acidimicrobiales bacterium]